MPRKGIPGLSFSWKRAIGLSQAKARLSKKAGIPLSKSARQRKAGRMFGCCLPIALLAILSITMVILATA